MWALFPKGGVTSVTRVDPRFNRERVEDLPFDSIEKCLEFNGVTPGVSEPSGKYRGKDGKSA